MHVQVVVDPPDSLQPESDPERARLNTPERLPSLKKTALNLTAGIDYKREILEGAGLAASPARVAWPRVWIRFSGVSEVKVPA